MKFLATPYLFPPIQPSISKRFHHPAPLPLMMLQTLLLQSSTLRPPTPAPLLLVMLLHSSSTLDSPSVAEDHLDEVEDEVAHGDPMAVTRIMGLVVITDLKDLAPSPSSSTPRPFRFSL